MLNENLIEAKRVLDSNNKIIVFDCETTGFSPEYDRIIEFAAVEYSIVGELRLELVEQRYLHLYIRPPFPVSAEITALTGLTNDFLSLQPSEEECASTIVDFFGHTPDVLCAHNIRFDLGFLRMLYERNHLGSLEPYHLLDTLAISRACVSREDCGRYKLSHLARMFGLDDGVQFHTAMDDARVTAKILVALHNRYL